jgi:hypothetical protein
MADYDDNYSSVLVACEGEGVGVGETERSVRLSCSVCAVVGDLFVCTKSFICNKNTLANLYADECWSKNHETGS